jgi:micrococcal nuclease
MFHVARLPVLLLAVAAVAGCGNGGTSGSSPPSTAVVASVADGDTLRLADGRRVRLVQIDAPEEGSECYADRAAAALARLAPPGTGVRLEADPGLDGVDRFGRLLRYVIVEGRIANLALVRSGAASPYFYRGERGAHAEALMAAATEARAAGRGLWGACPGTPLAPGRAVDTGPA